MAAAAAAALAVPAAVLAQEEPRAVAGGPFPAWRPIVGLRPVREDLLKVYPQAALAARIEGSATMRCQVGRLSSLYGCQVIEESPSGQGFGAAALELAGKYRIVPARVEGRPRRGALVDIPLRWSPALAAATRPSAALSEGEVLIKWRRLPRPTTLVGTYPVNAYRQHIPGKVSARCRVRANGRLRDCEIVEEQPRGYDFAKSAPRIIQAYQLDPAVSDGKGPEGLQVTVGFSWSHEGLLYSAPASAQRAP